jgi:NADH-quinone oxidoreductase subunit L
MVTAGVYMVCLLSPLFEYAPQAKLVVATIGAITALFAATVGLAQNDIKRGIAYSACSTCSPTPSSRPCCSWAPAR